jgi:hypothetical protein
MNDVNNTPLEQMVVAPSADPALVALLERMLADARIGRVIGIGIIAVYGQAKWQTFQIGWGYNEIHIGAHALQNAVLNAATSQPPSRIVRAR